MSNISKEKREKMLEYLKKLKEINNDDENIRAITEIENAINEKKYGLVWEKHTEKVDEMLEHHIPIFVEDETRKIQANEKEDYNFLLEGDNLHSLKLLEKTHKGKIDVIYIDPPYNTGNKDFIYNDSYVDKTDGYSHSKWLSFMSERLEIAKELLSDEGVIFISIDDNEQAQLKLLCDEVFGEENFVGEFVVNTTPNARDYGAIGKQHEYCLMYSKNISFVHYNKIIDKNKKFKYKDDLGEFNIHPLYNSNVAFTPKKGKIFMVTKKIILCVWEHNGDDSILYANNFIGAFTRGKTKEEAIRKMPEEIKRFQLWLDESPSDNYDIEIVQEKESDLQVRDADSDVLFTTEEKPLTAEEYRYLKSLVLKSAEDFHALYSSFPDKNKSVLPCRKTFYGSVPRTAEEMYQHTKNVNEYYFSEIGATADNKGTILSCREKGFESLESIIGYLSLKPVIGSYGEKWSVRKVLRRFIWRDRIHAKAMYRMGKLTFGEDAIPDIFRFDC